MPTRHERVINSRFWVDYYETVTPNSDNYSKKITTDAIAPNTAFTVQRVIGVVVIEKSADNRAGQLILGNENSGFVSQEILTVPIGISKDGDQRFDFDSAGQRKFAAINAYEDFAVNIKNMNAVILNISLRILVGVR